MIGFALTRVGRYIMRVPHAVVSGFSWGIGGMMLISQLDVILGVPKVPGSPASSGPWIRFTWFRPCSVCV
jgi:SulP family sulfate permease